MTEFNSHSQVATDFAFYVNTHNINVSFKTCWVACAWQLDAYTLLLKGQKGAELLENFINKYKK